MNSLLRYFWCTSLVILANTAVYSQEIVYVRDDVLDNYKQFVNDKNLSEITDFTGEFIRRDVVDMVIVQQALLLGGFEVNIAFIPGRLNYRNKELLKRGQLLLSFDSYWLSDATPIDDLVYISAPVIRKGEYHAGIFASPGHPEIFSISTLSELQQFSSVSTPKWTTDWRTLQSLDLKELIREDSWVAQANMVSRRLADFMLMPFYSELQETHNLRDIVLKPVPDVAILLNDSRHFVISKAHSQGEAAYQALNAGLAKLRSSNAIVNAYTQAGFLIDTDKYKVLNQNLATE